MRASCLLWYHLQGHLDSSTVWAVLHGVGEQIYEHLLDAPTIHLCLHMGKRRDECELMTVATLPHLCDDAPGHLHEIDGLMVQHQSSCLETNHIQQVFSEPI